MIGKLGLVGVGYVLGARAGRDRYEQIRVVAKRGGTTAREVRRWGDARVADRPRPTAAVLPDSDGQLSDGVVIETRLKARLLGAPVLRVDGTVLVSPGRLVDLPTRRVVDEATRWWRP